VISQQDLEDAKYVSGHLKTLILQRERSYKACRERGIYWDNYCLDVHENCLILEWHKFQGRLACMTTVLDKGEIIVFFILLDFDVDFLGTVVAYLLEETEDINVIVRFFRLNFCCGLNIADTSKVSMIRCISEYVRNPQLFVNMQKKVRNSPKNVIKVFFRSFDNYKTYR